MIARKLYDAIVKLSFAILVLAGLLSFLILKENSPPEAVEDKTIDTVGAETMIDENVLKGKMLFKSNCATCHNKNLIDDLTGPALGGVSERWADYPKEDLYAWIRNSSALIASGHPKAVELFKKYDNSVMTSFPLSDEEIAAILAFCDQ